MRRNHVYVGALVSVMLGTARTAAADCADPFARPDQVLDFHLQMTTATWAAFQASQSSGSTCDDQYPYFAAEFRCGDQEPYLAVGFRRKRDRTETTQKLPIKVDFNWSVAGQRWPAARGELGFRKLSLQSGQSDDAGRTGGAGRTGNPGTLSAILTEHLAWRLMRQELPEASGVAYARLTLHFSDTGVTRYQGLYILVEDIDRTAVHARFGVDRGLLVKTTDPACVDEVVFDDGVPNSASDLFAAWLSTSPADFAGGWYERTDQAVHLDALLRQEALRELLANTTDTVLGYRNNYYAVDLYGQRRWYLPWDLDDMFRPFPQVRAADTALVRGCTGGAGCAPNPIGRAIRDQAEIRPRYLDVLCRLTNGVALETKMVAELEAIDRLIRPIIASEVQVLWAPEGRDPLDATVQGTYASEIERLKTWIPARVQAVRQLVAAEGVPCALGCPPGAVVACDYLGAVSKRVCAGGNWGPCEPVGSLPGTGGAPAGGGSGGRDGAGAGGNGGVGVGAGGRAGGAAAGASGGGAGSAGGAPVAGVSGGGRSGGCSCAASGPAAVGGLWWPLLFALAVAFRRRTS